MWTFVDQTREGRSLQGEFDRGGSVLHIRDKWDMQAT